jgi:cholesterol oxidase
VGPKLGCNWIQRIHALPDILALAGAGAGAGAGVGGGSLNYANTLYEPKSDS